jgi:hypothetical protein
MSLVGIVVVIELVVWVLDFLVLFVGFDLCEEAGEPYGFVCFEGVFVSLVGHWVSAWLIMSLQTLARVRCWLWAICSTRFHRCWPSSTVTKWRERFVACIRGRLSKRCVQCKQKM